jgi:hypothetical protein
VLVPHGFIGNTTSPGIIGVSTVEEGVRNALVKDGS